jgi:hypothetical protein
MTPAGKKPLRKRSASAVSGAPTRSAFAAAAHSADSAKQGRAGTGSATLKNGRHGRWGEAGATHRRVQSQRSR